MRLNRSVAQRRRVSVSTLKGVRQADVLKEMMMDAQQNKQVIEQGYRLFQSGNIDQLLQLFADDIEWLGSEIEYVPFSRDYHGKQDVAQFFAQMSQAQDAQRFEPQEMIAEGDKVAVTGYAKWAVRSTGKDYEYPWVHVFTLRDGKVTKFQQYFDTAATRDAYMPSGMATSAGASAGATQLH
jgi:ketosteroid isomerase-like protein